MPSCTIHAPLNQELHTRHDLLPVATPTCTNQSTTRLVDTTGQTSPETEHN